MSEGRRRNRLARETSPYLLQHADNPVDWYPWGEEALEKARRENKPILLSVGYAACHWCHVMEEESFEDADTAALMNQHFVPVKVDREERPDLDAIYMQAVQALTGHGGWPMTVFLTPEGQPFYGGTYFPKEDRHGLPGFQKVLQAVAEAWRDRRSDAEAQGHRLVEAIGRQGSLPASREPLTETILQEAFFRLKAAFDDVWGGFGGAPKFPQPMTLEFLLRCHTRGYPESLPMLERTLDRMAEGGIHDHIGGGFHRYSVDARWHVPHFEKMLYDNAQLARLYARAWQVTGSPRYREVAEDTLDYLLREMRHPEGGFFSSQDADSEGEEGKFYVWRYEEIAAIAGEDVAAYFGAAPPGNWEGVNVLWTPLPPEAVAAELGVSAGELEDRVRDAKPRLFEARERRVRPGTDDKVLTAWNALAISALAEAGRIFEEPRYVEAAGATADFVLENLRSEGGRLLRSWREGRAGVPAYLDDYALLAEALLTLYETTFELRWFGEARARAEEMLRLFADPEYGGFFQTGSDAEALVTRPKELFDNAVPSGSSVAAELLLRLSYVTGEPEYERAAASALRLVRDLMRRSPTGFGHALGALDLYLGPVREVAIVGEPSGEETRRLVAEVWRRFMPNRVLAVAAPDDEAAQAAIPLLRDRPAPGGRPTAYVCEHFACRRPVSDPAALAEQLAAVDRLGAQGAS